MALEMRPKCEKCENEIAAAGEAYICIFECTFCPDCAGKLSSICPNCSGELVRRPRAKTSGEICPV